MVSKPCPLSRLPHTTPLLVDYVEHFSLLSGFFAHPPRRDGILRAAELANPSPDLRRRVADLLLDRNRQFGADAAVEANIEKFRRGAAAIVSGQQVGLFSGPAFTVYKALGALRLARELAETGIEAVPLFWMATEDHDLAEINQCHWATRAGFDRIELPFPGAVAGMPVGRIPLPGEVTAAVESACAKLEGPSSSTVSEALRDSYRPGEGLGTAFGRLLTRLFAGRGLIFVDPLDERLRRLAGDLYLAAFDQRDALAADLLSRAGQLAAGGYHPQVRVDEHGTLLFWELDGHRLPLESRAGKLSAGDATFAPADFRRELGEQPERASANVLLRPVVQDALLGTAAALCGAAEIAYLAQAEVVYRKLGVPMPAVLARPGFTLVEPPLARLLSKYGLEAADVFEGRQRLRALMERESLPGDLTDRFATGEAELRTLLGGLHDPLARLDPTLGGALDTAGKKILYQFEKLREKAGRALGMRSGVLDRHEQLLADLLYPHNGLQERTLCFLPMLAWQGMGLLDALEDCASPDPARHLIVSLE